MKALRYLVPLAIFIALVGFFAVGLMRDPREVPSPFIGKPAPGFKLETLHQPEKAFTPDEMKGKVWLLNVWASWCVSCRQEHPVLMDLARSGAVTLVGLDYKDAGSDARRWLAQHGDPYRLSVADVDGRVGIDYGVYGVPETYVIDKAGAIRYKRVGPLTAEVLQSTVLPMVRELQR